ncbi:uncharacterized protein CFAP97D2 [Nomia melanderi]|uniref:uncharacterized protein CFAP97D2 n=1 Tax=Nomia melanderi TaxID=2448451 RepID=UPI00130448D8|nr:uncharacterized protein CFAP97D2 [Nomia melanderi]XP_031849398.1 uncharacterized protein CFAP97D2 [Nomia melanderi]XP_031849399.1 uncharacterized protein CFAP97D2 [Nomia melanderi]XP_031849400.1 uncharacterized protein CFAP97D2 [Nomia melanderi]XP_031849401.1 uncharacterized protein CFAP97D2 [Nomia melanderi]XP_031849403.1 uncharacterized protein CFAP97D2 [Nomia melanderi]
MVPRTPCKHSWRSSVDRTTMSCEKKSPASSSTWEQKAYERHRMKVMRATCAIDVNPPKGRPHVVSNAKGLQLEREKQDRILRENFILLKKLRDIMHRKRPTVESQRLKWDESRCIRTR